MKWYYAQNNQRHGPITESEFDFLVHQKKIMPDTLVWNETMPDWRPLCEVMPEEPPPLPQPDVWSAPKSPVLPAVPERDGPAWEERDSIGGVKAAALTVKELLLSPYIAFARMKTASDWFGPFCFALFLEMLGYYVNLAYTMIICRLNPGGLKGFALLFTSDYAVVFMVIFAYFFIPLFVGFLVVFNSVLIHIALILIGGVRQPFKATYRVVCYSFGTSSALQFIPVLGFFLTLVWNLSLMIRGIARMHEISLGKAAIALMPVALYTGYFILLCLGMA